MINFILKKNEQKQILEVKIKILNSQLSLIMINAESIGIKSLDNEIMDYLNIEIEEKLKTILSVRKIYITKIKPSKLRNS